MDPRRVEPFFGHKLHGAVRRTAAFAANAKNVNIIPHKVCNIRHHRFMRERRETNSPATAGHVNGLIDGGFGARAFDHVIGSDPAGKLSDEVDRIAVGDIDDVISAQLLTDGKAPLARSRQDDRTRAERLGNSNPEQTDWSRTDHDHAFARNQPA